MLKVILKVLRERKEYLFFEYDENLIYTVAADEINGFF